MIHELKTDPEVFNAVYDRKKTFEIRWNDRDYKTGDKLFLRETKYTGEEMKGSTINLVTGELEELKPLEYTGRCVDVDVGYMLTGPIYGLEAGWVILGFNPDSIMCYRDYTPLAGTHAQA